MFRSKIFLKYFSTIVVLLLTLTVLFYALSVPFIKDKVYEIEEANAKTVLDNVYEIVRSQHMSLEAYREVALQTRKGELRDILGLAVQYIDSVDLEVKRGLISREDAQKKILGQFLRFRFGHDDYIYIFDYNCIILSHPDKTLQGENLVNLVDVEGKPIIPPMVEMALKDSEGYHTYKWRRLGTDTPVEKLTYFRNIPQWGWVICTGVYLDDIERVVDARKKSMISDLHRILKDVKIAKTGYIYVFDTDLFMVIHPNKNLDNTSVKGLIDPERGRPIMPEFVEIADKPEGVRYKWDKLEDPGNYIYDKITWSRSYKPLGWYIASSVYVEELRRSSSILKNRILIVAFAGLLVLFPIGYSLSRKLVSPLKELFITASKVKEGDLTAKSCIKSNDEIGILSDTFNGMVDQLRNNIETLDSKVKERTEELQEAYDKLKKLDEMKSAFLSNVSHELRTPLTSVIGFAEIIQDSFDSVIFPSLNHNDKKVRRHSNRIKDNINIILSEGQRLTDLINNVLDLTKIEAGKMVWQSEAINLKELLNHAVKATSSLVRGKDSVRFLIEAQENLPATTGDHDKILQVVINLISNAVKFTPEGSITLKATRQEGLLLISVIDTGIGIPPSEHNEVFEKFKQIGDTLTDKPRGTGLGLPICREIVKHHGGRIWVESTPRKGSTFSFTLPIQ
ncbi:MAG: cache domain-containing protein [Nitrospirae bacterium]|nr:cache domain-containing protein [Nitrospirota bacterium]MBF0590858.1 cache domain-containing protein [Nitrospirota bacterium]